jgi:hypothetical protein
MHVFVAGGSGLTGPAVVAELIAVGRLGNPFPARCFAAGAPASSIRTQALPG